MIHRLLSDADRVRIRHTIAEAETKTAGEIFAVVARESDEYRSIPLLWATLVALLVPLPLLFIQLPASWFQSASDLWERTVLGNFLAPLPAIWIYLVQLAVFIVLAIVLSIPAMRSLVVPRSVKRARAHALAVEQFLAHGLHTTEARTGVLIFVSLAERYAEIIADSGIAAKVDAAIWKGSIDQLLADIGDHRLADGLAGAIERAGAVLAVHFPPRPHDRNELPNDLILL